MNDEQRAFFAQDITEQLRLHKPEYTNAVCTLAKVEIERLREIVAVLYRRGDLPSEGIMSSKENALIYEASRIAAPSTPPQGESQ